MRLDSHEALRRLGAAEHGILATLHPERGADAVPVCFAVVDDLVGIPIDRVKPKTSARLQRVRNLESDPRATLLCERWDMRDWSRLWWVRARLATTEVSDERARDLDAALRSKYVQYAGAELDALLTLRIQEIGGWAASEG